MKKLKHVVESAPFSATHYNTKSNLYYRQFRGKIERYCPTAQIWELSRFESFNLDSFWELK